MTDFILWVSREWLWIKWRVQIDFQYSWHIFLDKMIYRVFINCFTWQLCVTVAKVGNRCAVNLLTYSLKCALSWVPWSASILNTALAPPSNNLLNIPNLFALETQFFITIERIVSIFTTEDAIELCRPPLIGTLSTHVAKLFAIATLYRGVMVRSEVPSFLLLHFLVVVVLVIVFCFFHNWLF